MTRNILRTRDPFPLRNPVLTSASLLVLLLAPAAASHPLGIPPVAEIVPAGTVVRTSLTFALDDTIILLTQAGAPETNPGALGPDALATQPGVQDYLNARYSISVPEGTCTATVAGGRDMGFGIRFLLDHTCPAAVLGTLRVHNELLRDVSPLYRLSVIVRAGGTERRAMIAPGATEATVDLTARAPVRGPGAEASRERSARTRGLERLFGFLDAGSGAGSVVASLLIAAALGALHGLGPGHGKTLVAAYLAGSRARVRHAFGVGIALAVTHTAAVIALGLVALALGRALVPSRVEPILSAVAAAIVIGLGCLLLVRRVAALRKRDPEALHEHAHDHPPTSGRSIAAIGLAGGIVPCPEAFGLLFVALTLGRVAAGLLLLVAFSAGLAAVLVAVSIAIVLGRAAIAPRLERSRAVRFLPVVSAALVTAIGIVLAVGAARKF